VSKHCTHASEASDYILVATIRYDYLARTTVPSRAFNLPKKTLKEKRTVAPLLISVAGLEQANRLIDTGLVWDYQFLDRNLDSSQPSVPCDPTPPLLTYLRAAQAWSSLLRSTILPELINLQRGARKSITMRHLLLSRVSLRRLLA
jgi:hypothetical protein